MRRDGGTNEGSRTRMTVLAGFGAMRVDSYRGKAGGPKGDRMSFTWPQYPRPRPCGCGARRLPVIASAITSAYELSVVP